MSSAGGGSGIGAGAPQTFIMRDAGCVQLPNGAEVDLRTPTGVAQAEAALSPAQLQELEAVMATVGFTRVGDAFVPRDNFEMRRELGISGPTSTTAGISASDAELVEQVFVAGGVPNPYNVNTTESLYSEINGLTEFRAAVTASQTFLQNSTNINKAEFISRMGALQALNPNGNVMEVLFLVFRESIQQTNEDKKYFLLQLQDFNKMAEEISDYLNELVKTSQNLSTACEGQKEPEKVHIDVTVKTFDLSSLDKNGNLATLSCANHRLDRAGLNDTIKQVESMQETVRNKRQMASTSFQNFDQKANQLYNLMSSVLKSVNEMRSGTIRNML